MGNQLTTLRMEQRFKNTPAGEIPVDWEYKRVDELAQLVNGHGFGPKDWEMSGTPIIRIQNLNGNNNFNFFQGSIEKDWVVKNGDLLFSWSGSKGTSFGPFIWRGSTALLNQHIFNVKSFDFVERKYLFYILRRLTTSIEERAHGSAGLVHVTKKELANFAIPIPPLIEQKKIAEILSAVDEVIWKTNAIIEKARELKSGVMQRLLRPKDTWSVAQLDDLGKIVTGGTPKLGEKKYWDGGFSFITPGDITENRYVQSPNRKVTESGLEIAGRLPKDSVLVTCIGSTIGKIAMTSEDCCTNQQINTIICNRRVLPSFLYYSLKMRVGFLRGLAGHTAVPIVSKGLLSGIQIYFPERDQQKMIIEELGAVDEQISVEKTYRQQLGLSKAALMRVLLTGRVRVTMVRA